MTDMLTCLQERSSIRKYTGERIPQEKLEKILQAGLLSPTSRGLCPWEFIVVKNKDMLQRMTHCRKGSADMLGKADCAVVVLGDRSISDTVIEDCSIAMSNMHNMADSLGLGSCWLQGRNREAADGRPTEDFLRELLCFPENYVLEAVLALGIPAEKRAPRELDTLDYGKIHWEIYGEKQTGQKL